jgi:hypothetical protein
MHDLSQYIREVGGVNIEALTQESHAFGDAWVEHLYTGVRRVNEITLSGYYDDAAATGPHALFGQTSDIGAEREIEFDFGSSDIVHFDYLLASYNRMPVVGELTRFEATIRPTGAVTTAT